MPNATAIVRTDVVDENYLTGYLYWQNGRSGISWNEPHASDDNVDPGNDSAGLYDDFVSAPLPQTLYLNVSRTLQVDLFFQGTAEKFAVDVVLAAGPLLLSGGRAGRNDNIAWCQPNTSYTVKCVDPSFQPRAPGYGVATHRVQAELDTLAKGTLLRLRVIHTSPDPLRYGLAESHASAIHLPIFSPDEVLFRVPKYQRENQPPQSPTIPPGLAPVDQVLRQLPPLASASLVGIGLGNPSCRASRRSRQAIALGFLFAASAFAGCTGGHQEPDRGPEAPGPGLGGSASNYIVPDANNETGLVSSTRGSIYGVVSDTDYLPVNGAYAVLIGTSRSTRTDPYGRFHFNDLEPGPYHVRIDRDGFKPYEGTVQVEAASITKIEVTLEFVVVKDVTQRPHRHDYWGGKDSIVLWEQTAASPAASGLIVVLPPPLIIRPGTVDIEMSVAWQGGGMIVLDHHNGRPDDPTNNVTGLYPRAADMPFHYRTTWEMTDPGHAAYSYWGDFEFVVVGRCSDLPLGPSDPGCPAPAMKLTLTIHRGIIPLERPHPNFWGSDPERVVLAGQPANLTFRCSSVLCPFKGTFPTSVTDRSANASVALPTQVFVPFETQWLSVVVKANRHLNPGVPNGEPDPPWTLFYHGARTRDNTQTETSSSERCQPVGSFGNPSSLTEGSRRAKLHSSDTASLTWTWRIALEEGEADPPYAPRSQWCFFVAPSDQNPALVDYYRSATKPGITFQTNVTAYKDPIPKP